MHYARDGAKPMTDCNRVDEPLSQAAHDWLARRSDIVDLDTEFAALEGVLGGQSIPRQFDRRHADRTRIVAVAASVLILAAGIAAIVWSQGNRHPDSVATPVDKRARRWRHLSRTWSSPGAAESRENHYSLTSPDHSE